jgi:hypothetical protein
MRAQEIKVKAAVEYKVLKTIWKKLNWKKKLDAAAIVHIKELVQKGGPTESAFIHHHHYFHVWRWLRAPFPSVISQRQSACENKREEWEREIGGAFDVIATREKKRGKNLSFFIGDE